MLAEADGLASWAVAAGSIDCTPPIVANIRVPAIDWLDTVTYKRKDWRYRAVLALLARNDPRDPLTGQRITVDRLTGTSIDGDHIFPQKWDGWEAHETLDRDNVANIAPITQYTNIWKGKRPPSQYVPLIIDLGVSRDRLRAILAEHLIDIEDLEHNDCDAFMVSRRHLIHGLITRHLSDAGAI
jgi:hypothetical protein